MNTAERIFRGQAIKNLLEQPGWGILKASIETYVSERFLSSASPEERERLFHMWEGYQALQAIANALVVDGELAIQPEEDDDGPLEEDVGY